MNTLLGHGSHDAMAHSLVLINCVWPEHAGLYVDLRARSDPVGVDHRKQRVPWQPERAMNKISDGPEDGFILDPRK